MLFATCSSVSSSTGIGSTCSINIAYNKQLPLCTSASASNFVNGKRICRPPGDLCTADPDFRFDLHESPDNDVCACLQLRTPFSDNQLYHRLSSACLYPTSSRQQRGLQPSQVS